MRTLPLGIGIKISSTMDAQLGLLAKARKTTISALTRQALEEFLVRNQPLETVPQSRQRRKKAQARV
jgi:predicted transcriptional regulator